MDPPAAVTFSYPCAGLRELQEAATQGDAAPATERRVAVAAQAPSRYITGAILLPEEVPP